MCIFCDDNNLLSIKRKTCKYFFIPLSLKINREASLPFINKFIH